MGGKETTEEVQGLLQKAHNLSLHDDYDGALRFATEAVQLDPQNALVHQQLEQIQQRSRPTDVIKSIEVYTTSWTSEAGKACEGDILKHAASLDEGQGARALDLLLSRRAPVAAREGLDSITKLLLTKCAGARRDLLRRLSEKTTITFDRIWGLGRNCITFLLNVLRDTSQWTSQNSYHTVVRGVFQLLLGKLIEAGQENKELAVAATVILLQSAPEKLKDLCDPDAFSIMLENMDVRSPQELRSGCTAAMQLMLKVTDVEGQDILSKYIKTKFKRGTNEDMILAFSAASATFPILPDPASKLFLTDGFLQHLVPKLQTNTKNPPDRRSNKLEYSALELISAACQDTACRAAISKYCRVWLQDVAETSHDADCTSLAALILAKTHGVKEEDDAASPIWSRDAEHLAGIMVNMLVNTEDDTEVRHRLEGLSYLSMEPRVREMLVNNRRLIDRIVALLRKSDRQSWATDTGCLTILSFLTQYRPKKSEEQKRLEQLKKYSEASRPEAEDVLEDDQHAAARCRTILATDVVSVIVSRVKDIRESSLISISKILLALATESKNRGRLAQLGAIRALITIYERQRASPFANEDTSAWNQTSHALAKILISVNPDHVFSSTTPAVSAIPALTDLLDLSPTTTTTTTIDIPLLATFESLLALTNLASVSNPSARDLLIRDHHEAISALLLLQQHDAASGAPPLIPRAATELVCNLMASPGMVALHAEGTPPSKHRLRVLLALTQDGDRARRSAAGGAVAQLTGWDAGVRAVLADERGVERVVGMCRQVPGEFPDDSYPADYPGGAAGWREMVHRGLVAVMNLVDAPGELGIEARRKVRAAEGKEVLRHVVKELSTSGGKDAELKGVADDVLKRLSA